MNPFLILIADEDKATRTFLERQLRVDGYRTDTAGRREQALWRLAARGPHLMVAGIDGRSLELLDSVRSGGGPGGAGIDPDTPVIVLIAAAAADEHARVRVFEHGADALLTKPFYYPELRERVRVLLGRAYPPPGSRRFGAPSDDQPTRDSPVDEAELVRAADRVRAKLTAVAPDTRWLIDVPGVGYRLCDEKAET